MKKEIKSFLTGFVVAALYLAVSGGLLPIDLARLNAAMSSERDVAK